MKKTICIVLSLLLALSLAGCGLFAGGSEKSQKKADVISLLDGEKNYTPPEGVDYDIYYVGQFDVNLDDEYGVLTELVQYGLVKNYHVIYGKDSKPVGQDDIYICDTAENTKALYDYFIEIGVSTDNISINEEDPTILVLFSDQQSLEAMILQYASYGIGVEADMDVATYAEFDAQIYSGYLITGE